MRKAFELFCRSTEIEIAVNHLSYRDNVMEESRFVLRHLQLRMEILLHPLSEVNHSLGNRQAEEEGLAVELFEVAEQ